MTNLFVSRRAWIALYLYCAAVLAWSMRQLLGNDGLSYLDMASNAAAGAWGALINGCWSPGYPALIGLGLLTLHPSAGSEFPLVHLVNFAVSLFVLWGFLVFFRHWSRLAGIEEEGAAASGSVTFLAFGTFLWFTLEFVGTRITTPDLAVSGVVYMTAGLTCRVALPRASLKHYAALGLVLTAGYYFKTIMLPFGVVLLVALFLLPPTRQVSRRALLVSFAVLLLASAPLIAALSRRAGTPSIGESGRLNYVWFVNRLPVSTGWTGGTPVEFGVPEHPPRRLMEQPLVLEFGSPIKGTYPLWYDPAYWYAGARARIRMGQQIARLKITLHELSDVLIESMAFVGGALALLALAFFEGRRPAIPRALWWQIVWPLAACAAYTLIKVEPRYLAPFFVVFWLGIYRALTKGATGPAPAAVFGAVLATVMVPFGVRVATESARTAIEFVHPSVPDYQIAGRALNQLGLASGARLAIVGVPEDCYYCRYARFQVVAELRDVQHFRYLDARELETVAERLASAGANAIVAPVKPEAAPSGTWKEVRASDLLTLNVLLLASRVDDRGAR